jgi:hypothetical protein
MAASGSIPKEKTLTGDGAGQNVAPTNSNPALSGVGPLCQLATGVSAPIAETIQNTIASLNSLQGTIDGIIYSPAVGINELQRKIVSGEILNNVTLKIQFAIGNILKNAAMSLATNAVTSAVTNLAGDLAKGVSNAIGDISSPLKDVKNLITDTVTGATRKLDLATAQLAAGVYKIASVPGYLITQAGGAVGGAVGGAFNTIGNDVNKILGDAVKSLENIGYGVTKTVNAAVTQQVPRIRINPPTDSTTPTKKPT